MKIEKIEYCRAIEFLVPIIPRIIAISYTPYSDMVLSKNEKVNSTHRPPSRFYFCTVDIFSFTPFMVCLDLLLTAMEGVYYE